MLGNFMEDMGITPLQFEEACSRENSSGIPIHFDQVCNLLFGLIERFFLIKTV